MSESKLVDFDLRDMLPKVLEVASRVEKLLHQDRMRENMELMLALMLIVIDRLREAGNTPAHVHQMVNVLFKAFDDGMLESERVT